MLSITTLRRELAKTKQSFALIDDGTKSLELNYLANAIMVLQYGHELDLSPTEIALESMRWYQQWTRYFDLCLSVGFDKAKVPPTYSFEAAA